MHFTPVGFYVSREMDTIDKVKFFSTREISWRLHANLRFSFFSRAEYFLLMISFAQWAIVAKVAVLLHLAKIRAFSFNWIYSDSPNSCITSELCTFSLREFPLFFPFYGLCVQPSPTGPFISAADPLHWKRGEEPIRVSVTAVVDVVTENRVTKPSSKKPWVCTSIRSILGIAE